MSPEISPSPCGRAGVRAVALCEKLCHGAIEFGIHGFILERVPVDDILRSLQRVIDGEIVVPKQVLVKSESWQRSRDSDGRERVARRIASLTRRQHQVLELLGQGKTNAEIANLLGITEHTARLHVSATLKALEVSNRTQAALLVTGAL